MFKRHGTPTTNRAPTEATGSTIAVEGAAAADAAAVTSGDEGAEHVEAAAADAAATTGLTNLAEVI